MQINNIALLFDILTLPCSEEIYYLKSAVLHGYSYYYILGILLFNIFIYTYRLYSVWPLYNDGRLYGHFIYSLDMVILIYWIFNNILGALPHVITLDEVNGWLINSLLFKHSSNLLLNVLLFNSLMSIFIIIFIIYL